MPDDKNNTGDWNTGDWNTGDWNTGISNTGNLNTGNLNTGNRNTGKLNTGNWNTGNLNTGNLNTGNRNTGDLNTGDWNTGNLNTGDLNTGDWNTGNRNTGYFCENEGPVMFFDLPCNISRDEAINAIPFVDLPVGATWIPRTKMTTEEITANPHCDKLGGYLKASTLPITEAFPKAWATLDANTKRRFMALPNFDADKFQRITGVDVRIDSDLFPQPVAKPKTMTIDGVEYALIPVVK